MFIVCRGQTSRPAVLPVPRMGRFVRQEFIIQLVEFCVDQGTLPQAVIARLMVFESSVGDWSLNASRK